LAPGSSVETPPTPIDNGVLYGGAPGIYSVHATGIAFIAQAGDIPDYQPKSSFDLTIQPEGGVIFTVGNWNLSIANSGRYVIDDWVAGDKHNGRQAQHVRRGLSRVLSLGEPPADRPGLPARRDAGGPRRGVRAPDEVVLRRDRDR